MQSPYDSQSFNRYSYTFNNPLSYTDPTGYRSQGPSDQHLTDAMRDRVEHVKVIGSKREELLNRLQAAATNSNNQSMFSEQQARDFIRENLLGGKDYGTITLDGEAYVVTVTDPGTATAHVGGAMDHQTGLVGKISLR